jgi:hypothetical protein
LERGVYPLVLRSKPDRTEVETKMKIVRFAPALVTVAALATAPVLAEDLTVVFKSTGPGSSGTSTQYYSSERMRTHDGDQDTIFEYGTGKIVSIDHKKKQYSETTLAEIEAAMKAASAQMEQQMASIPPAMRERMQGMMGGMGGEVTVTKGETKQVAGFDTQEYVVKMGENMTMHLWNTTAVKPPVPMLELRKLASVTGPMATMAHNPMFQGASRLAEKMKEIQGFTLAEDTSIKMMGRGMETSREATEVKQGPIPASEFDVAAIAQGCKKVDSPLVQMGRRK